MKAHMVLGAMSIVVVLTIGALCFAGEQPTPQAPSAPTIEGTYQLISRQLPDGTMLKPPAIMGLFTYTKSHRNFNIVWKDDPGKFFSYSLASTDKLTSTEYSKTLLFSILNDQIGGKDIVYDLSGKTQSVPVKVVFKGNKLTATAEGRFVDLWEKVP